MATPQRTHGRRIGRPISLAWLAVIGMMLATAGWSISAKLITWGMSPWLAYGLSLMFDLAGLICAEYARRAVERGTPAGLPRIAILGFVTVSGALNWSHGVQVGGTVAGIGLASVSAAVELLAELHRRDVRDEQRAARGLVAERMPHIPLLGWIMYPALSWRTLRGAVGARLDALDPMQQPAPTPVAAPPAAPVTTQQTPVPQPAAPEPLVYADPRCHAIRPLYDGGTRPGTSSMRDALTAAGHGRPADSVIRGQIRAEIERHEPHLAGLPPEALPMRRTS